MAGTYVDVDEKVFGLDSMYGGILDTVAYTRNFADEMRVTLTASIEELGNIVGTYNPDIENIPVEISEVDRPNLPRVPILETFTSDIWSTILSKVKTDIISGGNGLTDAVYTAILAREKGARRDNQDSAYRTALDAVGAQGFNLPSGQVAAVQSALAKETLSKDQDALNNILVKDFDTATENTRFAVATGVELEKILRQAWETTEERKVSLFTAQTEGIVAEYESLVKWATIKMDGFKLQAEIAIKNGELGLDAYNNAVGLAERIAETIANIASQSVASALGAINTSMSNSYSGSENRSESWGHSESLSESHSYTEG